MAEPDQKPGCCHIDPNWTSYALAEQTLIGDEWASPELAGGHCSNMSPCQLPSAFHRAWVLSTSLEESSGWCLTMHMARKHSSFLGSFSARVCVCVCARAHLPFLHKLPQRYCMVNAGNVASTQALELKASRHGGTEQHYSALPHEGVNPGENRQ